MDRITLIVTAIALTRAIERLLREDITYIPTLKDPWRNLLVGGANLIILPPLDALVNGASFEGALLTGFAAFVPSLLSALIGLSKNARVAQASSSASKAVRAGVAGTASMLFVLALALSQVACLAGSFEEARLTGIAERSVRTGVAAGKTPAEIKAIALSAVVASVPSSYCASLDSQQTWMHAAAVGAGALAAGTGIPALILPSDRDDVKRGLAATALGLSVAGAVLVLLADGKSTAWVRDCSQPDGAK